jgi:hypothetical protein
MSGGEIKFSRIFSPSRGETSQKERTATKGASPFTTIAVYACTVFGAIVSANEGCV